MKTSKYLVFNLSYERFFKDDIVVFPYFVIRLM